MNMENSMINNVGFTGNNNMAFVGNTNTNINIGFTLEDTRKLLDEQELRLYGTWLEQIEHDLQSYNPQTALNHAEKIIQSLEKKESLNTQLMARLKYIRGCCKYECGIPDEWIIDFLYAYDYEPLNRHYQEKNLFAQIWKGDYKKAEQLADTIISTDRNNVSAWAVKYTLNEHIEVPELVLYTEGGMKFKGVAGGFCKRTQNFKKLKPLFVNDLHKRGTPNITFENKSYWFILANLRLSEIIDKDTIFIFNQVNPEIKNHPDLPHAVAFLLDTIAHFEGTEKSKNLINYRYLLAYGQFLLNPNVENVGTLVDWFKKLDVQDKQSFLFLTACSFLQTQQFDKAIEFINKQTDLKPNFHYLKAYAYLQKNCFEEAETSAKVYFDAIETLDINTLSHFIFFLNFMVAEVSEKEKHFKNYTKCAKFPSDFFMKIAEFFTYYDIRPIDEVITLANDIIAMDEIKPLDDFYFIICEMLMRIGQFEEVYKILEPKVDVVNWTHGYDLYVANLNEMQSSSIRLLELLEQRRGKEGAILNMNFVYMELELLKLIPDFAKILDVVEFGLKHEPDDRDFIIHKLQALFELNKTSELQAFFKQKRDIFQTFSLKQLGYLSPFAVHVNDYALMIEILYPLAFDKENIEAREMYLSYLLLATKADFPFELCNKITLDSFVEVEINAKPKLYRVNEATIKNDPFTRFLLENEYIVGDVFEFGRYTFENNNPCKVVKIYAPIQGLMKEIMDEVSENTHPSSIFESVKIEGEVNFESINKLFVEKFGKEGDRMNQIQKKLFEQYEKKEASFTELVRFNNDNPLTTYYDLIGREGLQILPLPFFEHTTFQENTTLILDFTTVPLFFQLSRQINLVFKRKFAVSYFLVALYQKFLAEMKREIGQPLRLSITTEGVTPTIVTADTTQNNIEHVEQLLKWIDDNCEVRLVREKLDSLRVSKEREKKTKNPHFDYLIDTVFLSIRPDHILISDDSVFTKGHLSLLNNRNILSSEAYLMDAFENIYESQIIEQLLKFNYIGLNFGYSKVGIELLKFLKEETNLYEQCLANLSPMKTMNLRMFVNSIQLARIIYTHAPNLEKKKRETQRMFKAVSEGVSKENTLVKGFLLMISQQFLLFSTEWVKSVQEDFLIAFLTPVNENE